MVKIQIGTRLREIRKLHKLTQKELGDLIGLSQTAISLIEKGELSISLDSLYKFCSEFKIPIAKILEVEEESDQDIIKIMKVVRELEGGQRKMLLALLETFINQK